MSITVRPATTTEETTVLSILDGAALATDADRLSRAIEADDVLVAVAGGGDADHDTCDAEDTRNTDDTDDADDRILGALVLEGEEIVNVAVRPGRRDQGIGRALVEAAADRRERLRATFDPPVRPFYESLGFEVEPVEESSGYTDRLQGRRG